MIKTQLFQLCFVLMSAMLISALPSAADMDENRPAQYELVSTCDSILAELAKDSLVSNKNNEVAFNRCLSYYLAKFLTTLENGESSNNGGSNEEQDDEETKVRDTRRVKSIKHFWKRRAGSTKGTKKFW
jgi:hypothetical protein